MNNVTLIAIAVRSLLVLIFLLIGFRFLGKRQLGQMNLYDLAMVMLVTNAIQNALNEESDLLLSGLVSAVTLVLAGRFLTQLFLRSKKLQERVIGTPAILIHNGRVQKERMVRESVSEQQLMAALRTHGLNDPRDAKLAVLEIDGTLSVVPKRSVRK
jgi:uncharacterized membrane protein YcaP (DUF421 family)